MFPVLKVLTPAEVAFAVTLAAQYEACKKNRGQRISKTCTGYGVQLIGVVGELCVRAVHGGKLNQAILPDGDRRPDVTIRDGHKVEVKSITFNGYKPDMILEFDELERAEWFCLVHVILPDQGFVYPVISREDVKAIGLKKNYGHGDRFGVSAEAILQFHIRGAVE